MDWGSKPASTSTLSFRHQPSSSQKSDIRSRLGTIGPPQQRRRLQRATAHVVNRDSLVAVSKRRTQRTQGIRVSRRERKDRREKMAPFLLRVPCDLGVNPYSLRPRRETSASASSD